MKLFIQFDSFSELLELSDRMKKEVSNAISGTADGVAKISDIDECSFGLKLTRVLKAEGINRIDQLVTWSKETLLRTPNLGKKSVDEIIKELEIRGLKLSTARNPSCEKDSIE